MKWELSWNDPFTQYLAPFDSLVGDRRTWTTLTETVRGVIGSGSLVCQRIAAHSPILCRVKKGAQRIIRLASRQTTKRSPNLDAAHLTAQLRTAAVARLSAAPSDELWLIADGSELRKPYAKALPYLMKVRALDGSLIPGYRTLTVVGLTPQHRGVLYHRLFSSTAPDFVSEPHEVQTALTTVSQAIASLKARLPVTWILDSGFDDVAVWRTIWEQHEHLCCRIAHLERLVELPDGQGGWQQAALADARKQMQVVARAQTLLEVQKRGQPRAKRQNVTVEIRTCPIRLTYASNVRRTAAGESVTRRVWLVEIRLLDTNLDPWLLLTDWEVATEAQALRIFQMYRQRWSVEDSFKFTKECLGWEEVQLLDLEGIRMLVALAWVAAGFLYQMGVSLQWESVYLLAKLGGWEPRPNRKPGKLTLTRGLRRLLDLLTTNAFLQAYYRDHGPFPPDLAAFLPGWRPDSEL
jgi:Transposase DDE domain